MNTLNNHQQWTFLTNHTHVLLLLAAMPDVVLREVALKAGITERAVLRILTELEAEGFVKREKDGRKNRYTLNLSKPLRHPIEEKCSVADLINLIMKKNHF
ncbi:MAG: winged helix-turn-helix transcriptional regulator [Xanthomonadaceae bacterium]|nr:winged helix-turn-helix transcriptional regulator [Xanthomonadaceae bacterium]